MITFNRSMALLFLLGAGWMLSACGVPPCTVDGVVPNTEQPCCSGSADSAGRCCSGSNCQSRSPSEPPPDMCKPDGAQPTTSAPCCSGQTNTSGHCCSGSTCTAKADLTIGGLEFSVFEPETSTGTLYLCINKDKYGNARAYGDYLEVKNIGGQDATGVDVTTGIVSMAGNHSYPCTNQRFTATVKGMSSARTTAPFCCQLSVASIPSGYYKMFVYADWDERIDESNEQNYYTVANGLLHVK